MISNIYNSNRALYKIGERKGKTKAEIERIENLKLKPKSKKVIKPNTKIIILKENETIRDGKIVQIKDRKVIGAKRKKKSSKIFKQYKHLFR
jgi:hypothetical protein